MAGVCGWLSWPVVIGLGLGAVFGGKWSSFPKRASVNIQVIALESFSHRHRRERDCCGFEQDSQLKKIISRKLRSLEVSMKR